MENGRVNASIVYDTGALLAADRSDQLLLDLHHRVVRAHGRPIVPVVVLAQAWRGGPAHRIPRLLKGCQILPDDEQVGRAAGVACGETRTSDVVDAIVVATAVRHEAAVVTSDPDDLSRLAEAIGVRIRLYRV